MATSTIYIGGKEDKFYAIDSTNGIKLWETDISQDITTQAVISSDRETVYFGAGDLYALYTKADSSREAGKTHAGAIKWQSNQLGTNSVSMPILSSNEKTIFFVNSEEKKVKACYTEDDDTRPNGKKNAGDINWETSPLLGARNITSSPNSDILYVAGSKYLYAINSSDGSFLWTDPYETSGNIYSTPTVKSDGSKIFILDEIGDFHVINSSGTGNILVTDEVVEGSEGGGMNLVTCTLNKNEDTIYVANWKGNIFTIELSTGTVSFLYQIPPTQGRYNGVMHSAPLLDASETTLFVGSVNGIVYAINTSDGSINWQYDVNGSPAPSVNTTESNLCTHDNRTYLEGNPLMFMSDDGNTVAGVTYYNNYFFLYRKESDGNYKMRLRIENFVNYFSMSGDGNSIALSCTDNRNQNIWNGETYNGITRIYLMRTTDNWTSFHMGPTNQKGDSPVASVNFNAHGYVTREIIHSHGTNGAGQPILYLTISENENQLSKGNHGFPFQPWDLLRPNGQNKLGRPGFGGTQDMKYAYTSLNHDGSKLLIAYDNGYIQMYEWETDSVTEIYNPLVLPVGRAKNLRCIATTDCSMGNITVIAHSDETVYTPPSAEGATINISVFVKDDTGTITQNHFYYDNVLMYGSVINYRVQSVAISNDGFTIAVLLNSSYNPQGFLLLTYNTYQPLEDTYLSWPEAVSNGLTPNVVTQSSYLHWPQDLYGQPQYGPAFEFQNNLLSINRDGTYITVTGYGTPLYIFQHNHFTKTVYSIWNIGTFNSSTFDKRYILNKDFTKIAYTTAIHNFNIHNFFFPSSTHPYITLDNDPESLYVGVNNSSNENSKVYAINVSDGSLNTEWNSGLGYFGGELENTGFITTPTFLGPPPPTLAEQLLNLLDDTSISTTAVTNANSVIATIAVDADDSAVTTASTSALQHFSGDSGFVDNLTKENKRKILKNIIMQIASKLSEDKKTFKLEDKTEFLKFVKPTDDTIDLTSKLKDTIEIIKSGSSDIAVDMDNASVYVPLDDGDIQTFVDSVTGKEFTMEKSGSNFILTVADSSGGVHATPSDFTGVADQEGDVYTYVDDVNKRETIFVWGSVTASSNKTREIINFDISANGVRQSNEKITRSIFVEGQQCDAVKLLVTDSTATPTKDNIINTGLSHDGTSNTFDVPDLIEDTSYNAHTLCLLKGDEFKLDASFNNSISSKGSTPRKCVDYDGTYIIARYDISSSKTYRIYESPDNYFNGEHPSTISFLKIQGNYILVGTNNEITLYKWSKIDSTINLSQTNSTITNIKTIQILPSKTPYIKSLSFKNNRFACVSSIQNGNTFYFALSVFEIDIDNDTVRSITPPRASNDQPAADAANNSSADGFEVYSDSDTTCIDWNSATLGMIHGGVAIDNNILAVGINIGTVANNGKIYLYKFNEDEKLFSERSSATGVINPSQTPHYSYGTNIALDGLTLTTTYKTGSGGSYYGTNPQTLVIYDLSGATLVNENKIENINKNIAGNYIPTEVSTYETEIITINNNILAVSLTTTNPPMYETVVKIYKKESDSWNLLQTVIRGLGHRHYALNVILANNKLLVHDPRPLPSPLTGTFPMSIFSIFLIPPKAISDISSQTFRTMLPRPTISYSSPETLIKCTEIAQPIEPADGGTNTITSYSINPAIDYIGLTFNTATGVLDGTPTALTESLINDISLGNLSIDGTDYNILGEHTNNIRSFCTLSGNGKYMYFNGGNKADTKLNELIIYEKINDLWNYKQKINFGISDTYTIIYPHSVRTDYSGNKLFIIAGSLDSNSNAQNLYFYELSGNEYVKYSGNGAITEDGLIHSQVAYTRGAYNHTGFHPAKMQWSVNSEGTKILIPHPAGGLQDYLIVIFLDFWRSDGQFYYDFERGRALGYNNWGVQGENLTISSDGNVIVFTQKYYNKFYLTSYTYDGKTKIENSFDADDSYIDGYEPGTNVYAGRKLSISNDGKYLVVGGNSNIMIYELDSNANKWTKIIDWDNSNYLHDQYYTHDYDILIRTIGINKYRIFIISTKEISYYNFNGSIISYTGTFNVPLATGLDTTDWWNDVRENHFSITNDGSTILQGWRTKNERNLWDTQSGKIFLFKIKQKKDFAITAAATDGQLSLPVNLSIKVDLPPIPVLNGYIDSSAVLTIGNVSETFDLSAARTDIKYEITDILDGSYSNSVDLSGVTFNENTGQITVDPIKEISKTTFYEELPSTTFYVRGYIEDCTNASNPYLSTSEPVTIDIKVQPPIPKFKNFDISANGVRQSNEKITRSIFVEGEDCDAVQLLVTDSTATPTKDDIINTGLSHDGTSNTFDVPDLIEDTSYNAHALCLLKSDEFRPEITFSTSFNNKGYSTVNQVDYDGTHIITGKDASGNASIYKYFNNSWNGYSIDFGVLNALKMQNNYIIALTNTDINIYKWSDTTNTVTDISSIPLSFPYNTTASYNRELSFKKNRFAVISQVSTSGNKNFIVLSVYEINTIDDTIRSITPPQMGTIFSFDPPNFNPPDYNSITIRYNYVNTSTIDSSVLIDEDILVVGSNHNNYTNGQLLIFKYDETEKKFKTTEATGSTLLLNPNSTSYKYGLSLALDNLTLATTYKNGAYYGNGEETLVIYELSPHNGQSGRVLTTHKIENINNNGQWGETRVGKGNISIYNNFLAVSLQSNSTTEPSRVIRIYKKQTEEYNSWSHYQDIESPEDYTGSYFIAQNIFINNNKLVVYDGYANKQIMQASQVWEAGIFKIYSIRPKAISDISSQTFRTMPPRPTISYSSPLTLYKCTEITSAIEPTDDGINTFVSYSIDPSINDVTDGIAGLTFDTATGAVGGTPTETTEGKDFAITATTTDDKSTLPVNLTIKVDLPPAPVLNGYIDSSATLFVGGDSEQFDLSGTSTADKYEITNVSGDSFSNDVIFDVSTGKITVNPLGVLNTTLYVRGYLLNCSDSTTKLEGTESNIIEFNIKVKVPLPNLQYINKEDNDNVLSNGDNITFTTGRNVLLDASTSETYPPTAVDISGLPLGLAFDSLTGDISGVPTHGGVSGEMIVMVTNAGGYATFNFTYEVNDSTPPTISDLTLNPVSNTNNLKTTVNVDEQCKIYYMLKKTSDNPPDFNEIVHGPFGIKGYYPLYDTSENASNSLLSDSSEVEVIDISGKDYYMPKTGITGPVGYGYDETSGEEPTEHINERYVDNVTNYSGCTSSEHIFTNIFSKTSYTVYALAIDNAGLTSNILNVKNTSNTHKLYSIFNIPTLPDGLIFNNYSGKLTGKVNSATNGDLKVTTETLFIDTNFNNYDAKYIIETSGDTHNISLQIFDKNKHFNGTDETYYINSLSFKIKDENNNYLSYDSISSTISPLIKTHEEVVYDLSLSELDNNTFKLSLPEGQNRKSYKNNDIINIFSTTAQLLKLEPIEIIFNNSASGTETTHDGNDSNKIKMYKINISYPQINGECITISYSHWNYYATNSDYTERNKWINTHSNNYKSYKCIFIPPNGATKIEQETFIDFVNLERICIPESVTEFGTRAFKNCTSFKQAPISNSIKIIGSNAFENCNFKSLTLPISVEKIENDAFRNCTSLTKVDIPINSNLTLVRGFAGCSNLKSLYIPRSVIQCSYMKNLDSLTTITFNSWDIDNTGINLQTGVNLNSGNYDKYQSTNLKYIIVPAKVPSIIENGKNARDLLPISCFRNSTNFSPVKAVYDISQIINAVNSFIILDGSKSTIPQGFYINKTNGLKYLNYSDTVINGSNEARISNYSISYLFYIIKHIYGSVFINHSANFQTGSDTTAQYGFAPAWWDANNTTLKLIDNISKGIFNMFISGYINQTNHPKVGPILGLNKVMVGNSLMLKVKWSHIKDNEYKASVYTTNPGLFPNGEHLSYNTGDETSDGITRKVPVFKTRWPNWGDDGSLSTPSWNTSDRPSPFETSMSYVDNGGTIIFRRINDGGAIKLYFASDDEAKIPLVDGTNIAQHMASQTSGVKIHLVMNNQTVVINFNGPPTLERHSEDANYEYTLNNTDKAEEMKISGQYEDIYYDTDSASMYHAYFGSTSGNPGYDMITEVTRTVERTWGDNSENILSYSTTTGKLKVEKWTDASQVYQLEFQTYSALSGITDGVENPGYTSLKHLYDTNFKDASINSLANPPFVKNNSSCQFKQGHKDYDNYETSIIIGQQPSSSENPKWIDAQVPDNTELWSITPRWDPTDTIEELTFIKNIKYGTLNTINNDFSFKIISPPPPPPPPFIYENGTIKNIRGVVGQEYSYQDHGLYDFKDLTFLIVDNSSVRQVDRITPSFNFVTTHVTDLSRVFYGDISFNEDISHWDTGNVTDMNHIFMNAYDFNQPIDNWNTENVTDMHRMFLNARKFNKPIGNWNTGNVTDMNRMFLNAFVFNQPIDNWNTENVTDMAMMFFKAYAFNQPIETSGNSWNVSKVTNMQAILNNVHSFNQPIGNWNTGQVTNMTTMFYGAEKFNQDLETSGNIWNTENVISIWGMFGYAAVFNGNISNWNTEKVTTMERMFNGAEKFNQDLETSGNIWNTGKVLRMDSMFKDASGFNGNISNWNTGNVSIMNSMFYGAKKFNQDLETSGNIWNTGKVSKMDSMFKDASGFNGNISNWNTGNVTDMNSMFNGATTFNQDISGWNVSKVTQSSLFAMNAGFDDCNKRNIYKNWSDDITDINKWNNIDSSGSIEEWRELCPEPATFIYENGTVINVNGVIGNSYTYQADYDESHHNLEQFSDVTFLVVDNSNIKNKIDSNYIDGSHNIVTTDVTNMGGLFQNNTSFNENISHWDTGNVTEMWDTFNAATSFNQDISNWNTAKVKYLNDMFKNADAFNKDLSWNTAKVINMKNMFYGANAFNGDISEWDTGEVKNMQYMFRDADAFNRDLSWNIENVTDVAGIFRNAKAFNRDLSWNTGNVTDMNSMFSGATAFNRDLSWNTGKVTDMQNMFYGANAFNGDISRWDTSKVISIAKMFNNAIAFNGDISRWDTGKVTYMQDMFQNATNFNGDISRWDTSEVTNMQSIFNGAKVFNSDISNWNTQNVHHMRNMFSDATAFNRDLSWNVKKVTDMYNMFRNATAFNGNISNWNTEKLNEMSEMFYNASAFNGDISNWDVSKVTQSSLFAMNAGFDDCNKRNIYKNWSEDITDITKWYNIDSSGSIEEWGQLCPGPAPTLIYENGTVINNAGVIGNSYTYQADYDESHHNLEQFSDVTFFVVDDTNIQIKINEDYITTTHNLVTTDVTNMGGLFMYKPSFNENISHWDTGNVRTMMQMFRGTSFSGSIFNQDIGGWNTGEVTDMRNMFYRATSFNQDLSTWCVDKFSSTNDNFRTYFNTDANSEWKNDTTRQPNWGAPCP